MLAKGSTTTKRLKNTALMSLSVRYVYVNPILDRYLRTLTYSIIVYAYHRTLNGFIADVATLQAD